MAATIGKTVFEHGFDKGTQQTRLSMVESLIRQGIDEQVIMEASGLSRSQIQALQEEIQ